MWLRRMASRRSPSIVASASCPATHLAGRPAPGARSARARRARCRRRRRCPSRSRWCRCRRPGRRPRRRTASGPGRSRPCPASPSRVAGRLEHGHHPGRHLVVLRPPARRRRSGPRRRAARGRPPRRRPATPWPRPGPARAARPWRRRSRPGRPRPRRRAASSSVSSTGKPWVSCRREGHVAAEHLRPRWPTPPRGGSSPARRVRSKPGLLARHDVDDEVVLARPARGRPRPAPRWPPGPASGPMGLSTPSRRAASTARRTTRRST